MVERRIGCCIHHDVKDDIAFPLVEYSSCDLLVAFDRTVCKQGHWQQPEQCWLALRNSLNNIDTLGTFTAGFSVCVAPDFVGHDSMA